MTNDEMIQWLQGYNANPDAYTSNLTNYLKGTDVWRDNGSPFTQTEWGEGGTSAPIAPGTLPTTATGTYNVGGKQYLLSPNSPWMPDSGYGVLDLQRDENGVYYDNTTDKYKNSSTWNQYLQNQGSGFMTNYGGFVPFLAAAAGAGLAGMAGGAGAGAGTELGLNAGGLDGALGDSLLNYNQAMLPYGSSYGGNALLANAGGNMSDVSSLGQVFGGGGGDLSSWLKNMGYDPSLLGGGAGAFGGVTGGVGGLSGGDLGAFGGVGGSAGGGSFLDTLGNYFSTPNGLSTAGRLVGGLAQGLGSNSAARTQANAANQAAQMQMQMFGQNQANVAPWLNTGKLALGDLSKFLGLGGPTGVGGDRSAPGVAMFNPDLKQLAQTPGYQFQLQQGLDAVMNKRAAMGGANSGATMKGLNDYAQGLASTTYQNEFNNWNTTLNNIFSRLNSVGGTGANAALGTAGIGANAAQSAGNALMGAGNAQAAGTVGMTNAFSDTLGGIGNAFLTQQLIEAFNRKNS